MQKGAVMKQYRNYIFDLYGTLIDIETDEKDSLLWEKLSGLYSVYGADYSRDQLKKRYEELVREEEEALGRRMGFAYPEIRLERVFARLYLEAPSTHRSRVAYFYRNADELADSSFIFGIANAFRVISRKRFQAYPGTIRTLSALRERGCHIYLLSNAQRIFTLPEIEQTGIKDYFDDIFISSDRQVRKPDAAFMKGLLEKHGLKKEESVMVGNDYESDIGIAASCGLDSIFLNTFKLSAEEREKRLSEMRDRTGAEGYEPVLTVVSGDVSEIL